MDKNKAINVFKTLIGKLEYYQMGAGVTFDWTLFDN